MTRTWTRVILVGVGGFGRLWDDALRIYGIAPVAIVDPDRAAAAEAAERYGLPRERVFSGLTEEWLDVNADLVIDSAPPFERARRMCLAARRNLDLIVAKPAVLTVEDGRTVLAALAESEATIYVAMQKRLLPALRRLKDLCDNGVLGRIEYVGIDLQVNGTVWEPGMLWRREVEYPSLVEGAVHHLDLVNWLVGPRFERVTAVSWNPSWSAFRHDADFCAVLEGDLTLHYLSRWALRSGPATHYFSGLRIEGTAGSAAVIDGRLSIDGSYVPIEHDGECAMDLALLNQLLLRELIASSDRTRFSYEFAFHLQTIRVMEAIRDALATRGPVKIG